jgi:hypothetical protein
LGGSLFAGRLRGLDSDTDKLIHFVKRLVIFRSMYFAVRAGVIAQEKGCPTLGTVNCITIFIYFLYFSFFVYVW